MEFKKFFNEEFSQQELQMLKSLDGKIIDKLDTKNYEMYLIELKAPFFPKDMRIQLGINKRGLSIWSTDDQFNKNKDFSLNSLSEMDQMKEKLDEWLTKYNQIAVASHNDKKVEKWANILNGLGYKTEYKTSPITNYYLVSK